MTDLIETLGKSARDSANLLANIPDQKISQALKFAADEISAETITILAANQKDLKAAKDKNLSQALLDRLTLTESRIKSISDSVALIASLPDPIGRVLQETTRPNGLKISRVSVPLGVLGIIYESRPNVTADAISLSLKSRNCAILRGGSESMHSSLALFSIFEKALEKFDLPQGAIGFVTDSDRQHVGAMLAASNYIDVIVPRGGKSLTARVMNEAKMPVFAHLDGICHTYIHHSANIEMAQKIIVNAKMRRTGICGATETLLMDSSIPVDQAKLIADALMKAGCAIYGDAQAQLLHADIATATEGDWSTEYLDAKISIRIVSGVQEAVTHINRYGSHHTDAIVAEDKDATQYFFNHIESAIIMHNASTQFADGGEFGMGAEIGIATGKFHARGPVGVEQLTTYKYIVEGSGQIRA
ncbi:MAG: glutamate-5-semialdehyde dehydrogenase [Micavibrio aeruginosavorus]|uniref:Gamma-glutamyl phosphate reductase n=1 Tax=Micavibrio aeruginosavorus TaxID=349221 RepID=A0A2W5FKQ6_9BACT|nr:MAG: glutamate-5-semialdehyde dehydrogenase [Micavibrio aeruginosavorus]